MEGLSAGKTYRFQYFAYNMYGESPGSPILTAAASSLPDPPGAPTVDWPLSGPTGIYLRWAATSTGNLPDYPILGYYLEMDSGNGTYARVYDGSFKPGILEHKVEGLIQGALYSFRAIALNFNGQSEPSASRSYYICTQPTGFKMPKVVSQSRTQMVLEWAPPTDLGGCTVTGYAVFRDGGSAAPGDLTDELNTVNDPAVRDKPSLDTMTATAWPVGTVGQSFRLQIKVFTTQPGREALSEIAHALLASVPARPTDVPVSVATVTAATAIKVTFAASSPPDDGGSPIVSYELQMDDGAGGSFVSVHGFSPSSLATHYTVTENVSKGRAHRFRYRAKNAVGWGPYSAEASILAASVPSVPHPPSFSSFSSGTLTVNVGMSDDNGGTAIELVELWRDAGDDYGSSFTLMTGYDGKSLTYGLSVADGLALGKTYRLKTRSKNLVGFSDYSTEAFVAFGGVSSAPGSPERIASTRTSLTVRWVAVSTSPSDLSILGYVLNMDDGVTQDRKPVFIGLHRPEILSHQVGGLTTGLPYSFSVQAIN